MNTLLKNPVKVPVVYLRMQHHKEAFPLSQLVRLQSDRNYTLVILDDGRQILMAKPLRVFEQLLPGMFVRVHRSHIVNLAYVSHLEKAGLSCVLKDSQHIGVSRNKFKRLSERLKEYR